MLKRVLLALLVFSDVEGLADLFAYSSQPSKSMKGCTSVIDDHMDSHHLLYNCIGRSKKNERKETREMEREKQRRREKNFYRNFHEVWRTKDPRQYDVSN